MNINGLDILLTNWSWVRVPVLVLLLHNVQRKKPIFLRFSRFSPKSLTWDFFLSTIFAIDESNQQSPAGLTECWKSSNQAGVSSSAKTIVPLLVCSVLMT